MRRISQLSVARVKRASINKRLRKRLTCGLNSRAEAGKLQARFGLNVAGLSMDRLTPAARSALMARVRSKDTSPEIAVRKMLYQMGFRFRLHRRDLPGAPDIVLPGRKKVVWVHGCFWHRHSACRYATTPKSNRRFWNSKFRKNVRRDEENRLRLEELGWLSIVVWQCELRQPGKLVRKLSRFLQD